MQLTKPQCEAVQFVFEDRLTDKTIAKRLEIDVKTLRRWKKMPEFTAEHENLQKEFIKRTRKRFLTNREARLNAKIDRHNMLTNIIEQRAAAADPTIPGADTGLMIKRVYTTKEKKYEEYRIDFAAIRELDRLETLIAKELGQDKAPLEVIEEEPKEDLSCLTNEELDVMIMIDNKVVKHNPHLMGDTFHELQQYEITRATRRMEKLLEEARKNETPELKTA